MFYWISPNQNIKNFNKHSAVDLIRFATSGISRTDLADQMGLTRAAVTLIVNDLLDNGVILEAESRAIPNGRPPVVLEINPKRGMVAAVDMGATHINIALADFSAKIIEETSLPFDINQGPQICLMEVSRILRELADRYGIGISQLTAVGVGVPGPVIKDAGMVVSPPIMPGWDRFPIRDTLEKEWGCPVSLNNDAELGALGEWAYGAGRGEKNLAFIKVGSGIGAGLIINQQIYGGTTGSAGEIGHITIDENGPLCTCGNHGCMEAFAGGNAIALQAKKMVQSGKRTLLSNIPVESLTAQEVARISPPRGFAFTGNYHAGWNLYRDCHCGSRKFIQPQRSDHRRRSGTSRRSVNNIHPSGCARAFPARFRAGCSYHHRNAWQTFLINGCYRAGDQHCHTRCDRKKKPCFQGSFFG